MTVLKIMASLALVYSVWWVLSWMDTYSERKYRFPLFSSWSFTLMVIGWLLYFLSIYTLPDEGTLTQVYSAIRALEFPVPLSNSIVLTVLAAATFLTVYILLVKGTNILFGTVGWFVQLIGSVLIVPFLIFLIPSNKKKKKDRYVKVED